MSVFLNISHSIISLSDSQLLKLDRKAEAAARQSRDEQRERNRQEREDRRLAEKAKEQELKRKHDVDMVRANIALRIVEKGGDESSVAAVFKQLDGPTTDPEE